MKCNICGKEEFIGTLFGIPTCLICLADHTQIKFDETSLTIEKVYTKPEIYVQSDNSI